MTREAISQYFKNSPEEGTGDDLVRRYMLPLDKSILSCIIDLVNADELIDISQRRMGKLRRRVEERTAAWERQEYGYRRGLRWNVGVWKGTLYIL